jgi:hypothetical protein
LTRIEMAPDFSTASRPFGDAAAQFFRVWAAYHLRLGGLAARIWTRAAMPPLAVSSSYRMKGDK